MVSQIVPVGSVSSVSYDRLQAKVAQQDLELARWESVARNMSAKLGTPIDSPERLYEVMTLILSIQVSQ